MGVDRDSYLPGRGNKNFKNGLILKRHLFNNNYPILYYPIIIIRAIAIHVILQMLTIYKHYLIYSLIILILPKRKIKGSKDHITLSERAQNLKLRE